MAYCKDAFKLLKIKVFNCVKTDLEIKGFVSECPLYGKAGEKCPRLILEDATEEAIDAMLKVRDNEQNN